MKHSEDWYRGYQAGLKERSSGRRKKRITREQAVLIREAYASGDFTMEALAELNGVSKMSISRVVRMLAGNDE